MTPEHGDEPFDQTLAMPIRARLIRVAASASEWSFVRSLALAATPTKPKQALVAFWRRRRRVNFEVSDPTRMNH